MKEVINNNNKKNNNDNTGVWAIFTTIAIPVISTLKIILQVYLMSIQLYHYLKVLQ